MNPWTLFCHNRARPARGRVGHGTITVQPRSERRYVCRTCGTPSAATAGTAVSRLRTAPAGVTTVLTVLRHGCPLQASVAAVAVAERTVARWLARAGQQCQRQPDLERPARRDGCAAECHDKECGVEEGGQVGCGAADGPRLRRGSPAHSPGSPCHHSMPGSRREGDSYGPAPSQWASTPTTPRRGRARRK